MTTEYVVRDRMGKVVASYGDGHDAGKHMARLDPGAFVAKGSSILKWHVGTSKPMEREIRKLIGWPEPAPEFLPGKPATGQFVFGAPRKSRALIRPATTTPVAAVTPIETETTMATEKPAMCRKCSTHPAQPLRGPNKRLEFEGLCKLCKVAARDAERAIAKKASKPSVKPEQTGSQKQTAVKLAKAKKLVSKPAKAPRANAAPTDAYVWLENMNRHVACIKRLGGIENAELLATVVEKARG